MSSPFAEGPHGVGEENIASVLERISGAETEARLLELARVGGRRIEGTPEQPERYAVSRLALSETDTRGRDEVIRPMMERAGMSILDEHPFGLIGIMEGTSPELPPLVILSHTDSVPDGDMYDGDLGVVGGIQAVEAMRDAGIQPERSVIVMSLTGEESSGFGFALFGSRGIFHGLTDAELDASIPGGLSIRETLGPDATEVVKVPIVGPGRLIPTPEAVLELHVEQGDRLDNAGIDLGVIEAIAAPTRFSVTFGERPVELETEEPANAIYLRLRTDGKSDHSGATPMGLEHRADGLAETAHMLVDMAEAVDLDIGDIVVDGEAINKVPGVTTVDIRVGDGNIDDLIAKLTTLQAILDKFNQNLNEHGDRFATDPISAMEIDRSEASRFFKRDQIQPRQLEALNLIGGVQNAATMCAALQVVGTVGTYSMSEEGILSLGLDIRGIEKASKDDLVAFIRQFAEDSDYPDKAKFGDSLPGSGDPVTLDSDLVQRAKALINEQRIGSSQVMFSAAGHDAQNSAKAGFPTVMVFCQSNNGGVAHHPDAYTKPANLEKGVRALTALTLSLAA